MPDTACDWWLALGSNADEDDRLMRALSALSELGELRAVSEVLTGPDISGGSRTYRNQLVRLHSSLSEAELVIALKRIEQACGRSIERTAIGICDLDVDLLARVGSDGRVSGLSEKPLRIPVVRALAAQYGLLAPLK